MSKRKKGEAPASSPLHGFEPAPSTEEIISANYAISRPYGGGIFGFPKRYQLDSLEHDAIATLTEACNELPALRALAAWAEANGAPEALLEALASARNGARWAVEGREMPEGWKPYRSPK